MAAPPQLSYGTQLARTFKNAAPDEAAGGDFRSKNGIVRVFAS